MSLRVFLSEAVLNFPMVASVAPSSKFLATAMLKPLPLESVRVAVELGAGTGVITHALLDRLPSDAKLLVFEINPRLYDCLRQAITDPRAILINADVENLDSELRLRGIHQVDAAVSSLGLAFMNERQRHAIFQRLAPFFHEKSVFTQYQYIHGMQFIEGKLRRFDMLSLLSRYFRSVRSTIEWRNLPPAFVFACQARAAAENSQPARP